jgi:broad specificity phosphatase PhoE
LQREIEEIPDLHEVSYGDWEGRFFHEIRHSPIAHQVFNDPINAVFPNGESLPAVQQRGVQVIETVRRRHPQGVLVLVSHGDVIRTVLAHYLGMPFNEYRRINLDLGALSALELVDDWIRVKAVNFVPQPGKLWLESFYSTWQKLQNPVQTNGVEQPLSPQSVTCSTAETAESQPLTGNGTTTPQ